MRKLLVVALLALCTFTIHGQNDDFLKQAFEAYDLKDYQKAIELTTLAIENNESPLWKFFYLRSVSYSFLEQYEKALEDAQLAIKHTAKLKNEDVNYKALTYYLIADIYEEIGSYWNAIYYANLGRKSNPSQQTDLSLLMILGNSYFFTSDFKKSANCYANVIARSPDINEAKVAYARALLTPIENAGPSKKNTSTLNTIISKLSEVIKADSTYSFAYKFRSRAYSLLPNLEKAIQDAYYAYESSEVFLGEIAEYNINLFITTAKEDSLAAERFLNQLTAKEPMSVAPFIMSAKYAEMVLDSLPLAIENITKAMNNSQYWIDEMLLERASYYYENKQYSDALNDLHIAEQRNDSNAYIYYLKGAIYMETKAYGDALDTYSKYIETYPKNSMIYYVRSNCYFEMDSFPEGLADLDSAFLCDTTDFDMIYDIANLQGKFNLYVQAIDYYKILLDMEKRGQILIYPTYKANILNNMSYYYAKTKDLDSALKLINKALKISSESHIWDTRGETYYWLGQYKKCIADMNKSIKLNEEASNSYFYRGLAKKELGDITGGDADIQKAAELKHEEAMKYLNITPEEDSE